jgi:tRNA/rRNA methyltransferase
MIPRVAAGETVALVFGRERNGLEAEEVGMSDRIVTLPVNPAFASLNLAQAVVVVAYEWFKRTGAGSTRAEPSRRSPPAAKQQVEAFFSDLERELEKVEFFRPPEKRGVMQVNLRNIFHRLEATKQDMRTLHGVIMALVNGSKGPARGGVLDPTQAQGLREMIAEQGAGRARAARTPVRGLARLLRRNPTEAERTLWRAMTADRRFASLGFKWQVPVGPHIADFVSFPLKTMIDLIPATEAEPAQLARAARRKWMLEHKYRIIDVQAADVEFDVKIALDALAAQAGSK